MNKSKIEAMRKPAAKTAAAQEKTAETLKKTALTLEAADEERLAQFFAARLASLSDLDYAPHMGWSRPLARKAFGEAVSAFIVWKREIAKIRAEGVEGYSRGAGNVEG